MFNIRDNIYTIQFFKSMPYPLLLYTLIFFLLFTIWKKDAVSVDIARVGIACIDIAFRSFSRAFHTVTLQSALIQPLMI